MATFKITKKGSNNFWHTYNNNSKVVNLTEFEVVLDSALQTFSISMRNGANVPNNVVSVFDIIVIDETDGSVEETFTTVEYLRVRLIALNYTPYILSNGFVPEAPIDGQTYGRQDAEWVEVTGGSQTLAQTLTNGNTTGGENISISDGDAIILDNGSKIIKGTTNAGLGGSKGIALRCAVDYELKWEAGRLYVMEQDGFTIREVSHNFTTAPTVNDDTTKGFAIGSRWILDNGNIYICEDDNIGVAVWELQTAGVPDATTVVKGIIKLAGDLGGSASLPTVPALGNKVDKITPITGATKTKVTYNTQGQVTAGADATTADIADSVNKRYQTDAQETVNDATSSIQTQLNGKVNNTGTETIAGAKTFSSNIIMPATGTPLILSVSSGGTISGLDTTTYPSLTELATVKGVTSAIQTQINSKQATLNETNLGAIVKALTAKTTPIGADTFLISDSADSDKAKEVSYTDLSATLKAYFDTIYIGSANTFKRILNSTVQTSAVTGTTAETLLYSAPVIAGGSFAFDDYFNFQMTFRKNGASETSCTYRVKISNTNNYATSQLLATWISQRFNTVIERKNLFFKADGTLNTGVLPTANAQTDLTNTTNVMTALTVTPASDIYLFISVQLVNSTENVQMTAIRLSN